MSRAPRWGGPRRPRPFAAKRPVRWLDGNSTDSSGEADCSAAPFTMSCLPNTGRELLVPADVEWSDKNEVTIERIVGSIACGGITVPNGGQWQIPVLRLGIVVVEDHAIAETVDLWDRSIVQNMEWMWLTQRIPHLWWEQHYTEPPSNQPVIYHFEENFDIDIRVKRRLGHADKLYLHRQFAIPNAALSFNVAIDCFEQLRVLVKS